MANLRLSLLHLMAMAPPEPDYDLPSMPITRGSGFTTKFPAHGREKHAAISKRRKASKVAARNRKRARK